MSDAPQTYLTVQDLAGIFGVSVKTIQNRLAMIKRGVANSDILPSPSRLPLTDGPRWLPSTVARWQLAHDNPETEPRRLGRPTKAEQIQRRLSQSVAIGSGSSGNVENRGGNHRANQI